MAKVITGMVRFSYLQVFEPKAIDDNATPKYSVSIIIPKDDADTIAKIEAAIKTAFEEGKAKFGGKLPTNWKNPLRDGDEERPDDEAYENSMFVNCASQRKPGIVDADRQPILTQEELYSGCYGRVAVNFYAFNAAGNKGVAAGLNNLQKLDDGDRLSGGASAEEDFDDGM